MWIALLVLAAGPFDVGAQTKKLALSKKEIQNVPAEIAKLKKLEELDLSYNPITELPNEIGDLTSLQSLNLRCTKLKKLPDSLANLKKLKRLDLSSAMDCEDTFRMSPHTAAIIGKLSALTELKIAFMHIKTLPSDITKLAGLRVLDLSYNELSTVPKLPDLIDLDLSGNELTKVPPELPAKLHKLAIGNQRGKTTIAPEQIEALKQQLPKAKIVSE